jgi:D-threo-aldose 1-dehydrogenase
MDPSRKLGKTSLHLPTIGLGCAPLAGLAAPLSESVAVETLSAAWDAGVRYFDTSPWYGRGLSELRLGQFLRQQPRGEFIVSTKVGRTFHRPRDAVNYRSEFWAGGLPFEHRFDYTYDGIMRSYESSLARLGLNTIDLLLIHDLDTAEIGSVDLVAHHFQDLGRSGWRALESLRQHGEIKAVGAGVNIRGTIVEMLRRFDLDFFLVAMPYTLLDQAPLEDEFPLCAERGAGIIIGSPFASGILASGSAGAKPLYNYVPAPPDIVAKTRRIEGVCNAHGVSLKAAAVQFPLLHPLVDSVLCGAIGIAQARENARLIEPPINKAFWDQLRREGLIRPESIPQ